MRKPSPADRVVIGSAALTRTLRPSLSDRSGHDGHSEHQADDGSNCKRLSRRGTEYRADEATGSRNGVDDEAAPIAGAHGAPIPGVRRLATAPHLRASPPIHRASLPPSATRQGRDPAHASAGGPGGLDGRPSSKGPAAVRSGPQTERSPVWRRGPLSADCPHEPSARREPARATEASSRRSAARCRPSP
jgi:hypothetical protein